MASNLFDYVARAKQLGEKKPTIRRAAKRLEDAHNQYVDRRINKWRLDQEVKRFETVAGEHTIRTFNQKGGTKRLGVGQQAARVLQSVTSQLGPLGRVIQKIFTNRDNGYSADQVRAAADLLTMQGMQETVTNQPGYTRVIDAAIRSLEGHGWSIDAAMQTLHQAEKADHPSQRIEWQEGEQTESKATSGRRAVTEGMNTPRLSPVHRTPESSNVYSFQYDHLTQTCYIQYKAPSINPKAVTNYRSAGGMTAMAGDMGKTITGKTNSPGPLYAYYKVPLHVYKRLVSSKSAGGAVWDEIRQRGSVEGHQFRYGLVEGAVIPGEDGQPAHYVPRRAVSGGFQSRSVTTVGSGRRRHVGATLPQDMRGHDVIRSMRHRPSRGRPAPPNRGRPSPPSRGR